MPSASSPTIVIVGAGPRGVSLLERLGANLPESPEPLVVHVIDDTEIGAGRIWRTDQSRELCMNTLANAVTLFTDESVTMAGPVVPGPTLYEWCLLVRDRADRAADSTARTAAPDVDAIAPDRVDAFDRTPLRPGLAGDYRDELAAMRPQSHPSRSLYGEYSRWCYARALQRMPRAVEIVEHIARATSIAERDGRQVVALRAGTPQDGTLQDGTPQDTTEIVADAIIVAAGWMPRAETAEERELRAATSAHPDLVWVRPDSPVDQDVDAVPDGAVAIVRGLGMGFFDIMALLSVGRGGRFREDPSEPGGLRYEPSGREPVLHVTSHRGVPYRAKTLYGSLPPRASQRHLRGVDWDAIPRPIDFDAQVWPLVLKDAFADYYETLHRVQPDAVSGRLDALLQAIGHAAAGETTTRNAVFGAAAVDAADGMIRALETAVAPFVPDPADRFDLTAAMRPADRVFDSPAAFDTWVASYVTNDLAEAERGRDSPLKAGLWSISSARGLTGTIGSFGGFDAESRAQGFRTLHSFGGMVGSGPPAFRNRQLLALARAGLVHFIGPRAHVTASGGVFRASSPTVRGSEVEARVLVDAWMHFHDVSASADPLTASLLEAGRARAFAVPARAGTPAPTGGFDIDPATGLLVHPDGAIDSAVHIAGIPVDEAMHDTIISPMPGSDPTMLRETDRVARSALRIATRGRRPASERTKT